MCAAWRGLGAAVRGKKLRGWGGSLNTTAATMKSGPASLSCYLPSDYTPRPVALKGLQTLLLSALRRGLKQTRELPRRPIEKAAPCQHPHLVGLDETHKYREEHRGWSCLGALSEVAHHTVEGFLELSGRRVEAQFINTVESGLRTRSKRAERGLNMYFGLIFIIFSG